RHDRARVSQRRAGDRDRYTALRLASAPVGQEAPFRRLTGTALVSESGMAGWRATSRSRLAAASLVDAAVAVAVAAPAGAARLADQRAARRADYAADSRTFPTADSRADAGAGQAADRRILLGGGASGQCH